MISYFTLNLLFDILLHSSSLEAFVSFSFSLGISNLQNDDGSFNGDQYGEIDTRFSYCCLSALSLLGRLDLIHRDKAIDFITQCQNFDGAFGVVPGSESHAAQSMYKKTLTKDMKDSWKRCKGEMLKGERDVRGDVKSCKRRC